MTLEGTVQEIYSQVKDLTGSTLKPVDVPKDGPKHKLQTRSKVIYSDPGRQNGWQIELRMVVNEG